MHELALTRSLVAIITDRVPGVRVVGVRLEIGKLSGVFADSVRVCFDVVTADTQLDGAVLKTVEPPGQGRCRDCDAMIELTDLIPAGRTQQLCGQPDELAGSERRHCSNAPSGVWPANCRCR